MVRSCKKLRGRSSLDWTNIGPKAGRRVVKHRKPDLGPVAQLVEHLTFNQRVAGSSHGRLTRIRVKLIGRYCSESSTQIPYFDGLGLAQRALPATKCAVVGGTTNRVPALSFCRALRLPRREITSFCSVLCCANFRDAGGDVHQHRAAT